MRQRWSHMIALAVLLAVPAVALAAGKAVEVACCCCPLCCH